MNRRAFPHAWSVLIVFLFFAPRASEAQIPTGLSVALNGSAFGPGQTMVVTARLTPLSTPSPVDAYIVAQLPGGALLSLQLNGGIVPGIVPLARSVVPFSFVGVIAQYTFTGIEPHGMYTWYSVLTQPGTLNFVSPLHQTSFTVGLNVPPTIDENEQASTAVVTLGAGTAEDGFNAAGAPVTFNLAQGFFGGTVALLRNGQPIPASNLSLSATALTAANVLLEGKNALTLIAQDSAGGTIYKDFVLWAGNNTLTGTILNESGSAAAGVPITARLGDDQRVVQSTSSSGTGQFQFTNLPDRTIIIEAVATGNRIASVAVAGNDGSVQLRLKAINAPSPIANNDFSQGTAGWSIGTAPVQIVPHQEGATDAPDRPRPVSADGPDMDLVLNTAGEGPVSISRTFQTQQGTQNVTVRYRFITSEVPGGYFGTEFNDYFSVSIRSVQGGGVISESASMNGLGLAAFDANGATAWREATLPLVSAGDTIQVDLTVANVADDLLDSQLVIDFVKEKKLNISALLLNDIDGVALTHLSTDAHTYFAGNTRVHGTVTVEGAEDDSLQSLVLEIVQGGAVVATADLTAAVRPSLLKAFGAAKKVAITATQLLFELPSAAAAAVNGAGDGTLTLRARARSAKGEEATKEAGTVQLLVKFDGANRYGGRDEGVGGDDWARPSMLALINSFAGLTWGDFSNMNGGPFPPHASHNLGLDADGWFAGYNARDAATATTIIGHLNSASGSQIAAVFVTFDQVDTDPFWQAIKDVVLNDGRRAPDVIRPMGGHTTHFHWRKN